jgi:hypothetical protein
MLAVWKQLTAMGSGLGSHHLVKQEGGMLAICPDLTGPVASGLCITAGGNPVLGYLLAGALVGPHALGLIQVRSQTSSFQPKNTCCDTVC